MPYFLSLPIKASMPGLWKEGAPYERKLIYDGCRPDCAPGTPPVNYDAHIFKPHSLTHADAPAHIAENGKTIEKFFGADTAPSALWGKATVLKFEAADFVRCEITGFTDHFVLRISLNLLKRKILKHADQKTLPDRILISANNIPKDPYIGHDPRWVLVLEEDAAEWLVSNKNFVTFGTSWKSTDFAPGKRTRPIHEIIFRNALIFECLDLIDVPEGEYFWVGVPLRIEGASESPVCPILLKKEEVEWKKS